MKKIVLFFALCNCLTLASCGLQSGVSSCPSQNGTSSVGTESSQQSHFGQALYAISKYDVRLTAGFDYSVKQYFESEVVNSKSVQLRATFENGTRAKKIVRTKALNKFGQGEQYSLNEVTTYFRDNQICENDKGVWRWRAFNESEYFETNLSAYSIDEQYFINISETLGLSEIEFSADVPPNYIGKVLKNSSAEVSQLRFNLIVKDDYSMIKSLSFSYNQQNTNSEISFSSIFDSCDINFPA